jgi:Tol biopolymer transport system component
VTSGLSLDRSQTVVPGGSGSSGPMETGPAETGPTVTGPTETDPSGFGQSALGALPDSVTDYLVDLETGARTPLPESIVGAEDVTSDYVVSPDGSRLAYVSRGDSGGVGIFVANLDGTGIEQVTVELRGEARPSGEAAPAWSPDGSKIAYIGRRMSGAHGNVYLLELATGMSTQVTDDPRDGAQSPTFSPDGSSIVYSAHRKGGDQILAVPVAGGASVPLMGGDAVNAATVTPVELSPDGSLLSYSCGDEYGSDLCLSNADGTDASVLVAGGDDPSWSPDGSRIAFGRWQSGVYVVDVASGEETWVAEGAHPTWLDGHTLIVEADGCSNPPRASCPF